LADIMTPILEVNALIAGYGKKQVLNGVDATVFSGEIVSLIGHNGAGKSTLLRAIFGLIPVWYGQVHLDGEPLLSARPSALLRAGVAYVPQGGRVFSDMTVRENLEIAGITAPDRGQLEEGLDRALGIFPALKQRLCQRAETLSGGERQMLALANALILSPRLLLLDEPSLGLALPLVKDALKCIQRLNRDNGVTFLVVEQKVREVLEICHRVYCLKLGQVVYEGAPQELKENPDKLRQVFL